MGDVYEVGGAPVFLEPPVARHRYPNAVVMALTDRPNSAIA